MDILSADAIGGLAGTLTTLAFVPQVVKAWRTQSVGDLSLWWLLSFTTGVGLWTLYGVELGSWPLVATNGATFVLALALLGMKVRST